MNASLNTNGTKAPKIPSAARAARTARERAAREAAKKAATNGAAGGLTLDELQTQMAAIKEAAAAPAVAKREVIEGATLSTRAMLANLTIHRWMATLTDKKITQDVADQHQTTSQRLGKYKKNAIDVQHARFVAICNAAGDLRQTHYNHTLPWGQDGARILTTLGFEAYSQAVRQKIARFNAAADQFAAVYPELVEAARAELNGAFNAADYPRHIRAKFGVDLTILPLPDAADFRADLSDEAVSSIKTDIEAKMRDGVAEAMKAPYQRLYELVERMARRLSVTPEKRTRGQKYTGDTGTFRDSLVEGLAELCTILPGLNLTNDAKLDELRKQTEQMIAGIDAATLRTDMTKRAEVAKRATEISNVMAAYMGVAS
jgi:hypothetical protein